MTGRTVTLQCVFCSKPFLWGLVFALILFTLFVWPMRTNAALLLSDVSTETQPFNNAMQQLGERAQPPMQPGAGMQQAGGMPPPPGPPPDMSSSSYSYGSSEITIGGIIALVLNAVILCGGVAFALLYHRGRKCF